MGTSNYIPAGRTSMVNKDDVSLQVQTEYAHRPSPRITTTITRDGQVVHKVERALERPVSSLEEQEFTESTIRQQHAEILSIIKSGSVPLASPPDTAPATGAGSVFDRLSSLQGVRHVYRLDNDGNFRDGNQASQFRQAYAAIYKSLKELMQLFERISGVGFTRRQGVYEVERDRLYFASVGLECYFIVIGRVDYSLDYEQAIKSIIDKYS